MEASGSESTKLQNLLCTKSMPVGSPISTECVTNFPSTGILFVMLFGQKWRPLCLSRDFSSSLSTPKQAHKCPCCRAFQFRQRHGDSCVTIFFKRVDFNPDNPIDRDRQLFPFSARPPFYSSRACLVPGYQNEKCLGVSVCVAKAPYGNTFHLACISVTSFHTRRAKLCVAKRPEFLFGNFATQIFEFSGVRGIFQFDIGHLWSSPAAAVPPP